MIYFAEEKKSTIPCPGPGYGRMVLKVALEGIVDGRFLVPGVDPEELPEGLDGITADFRGPEDSSLKIGDKISYKSLTVEVIDIEVKKEIAVYKLEFHYEV